MFTNGNKLWKKVSAQKTTKFEKAKTIIKPHSMMYNTR
jgi:hypothetical protein